MFGSFKNPFHNGDLVNSDNLITKDEQGQNPGYDEKGPVEAPALAGDHSDDDGQALDDLLAPQPQGISDVTGDALDVADAADSPTVTPPNRVVSSPFGHRIELSDDDTPDNVADETTRILQARVPIGAGYDPQLLFPRDANRLHLVITGDDDFQWGNSKSDVYAPGYFPGGFGLVLDKHTGAVWVYNPTAATGSYVKAWCVTK